MPNPKLNVRISPEQKKTLQNYCTDHNLHMGRVVDAALALYFTPPSERDDVRLETGLDRLSDDVEGVDLSISFLTDLFVEFLTEWIRTRPSPSILWNPKDDARVERELNAITERVLARIESRTSEPA